LQVDVYEACVDVFFKDDELIVSYRHSFVLTFNSNINQHVGAFNAFW